MGAAYAPGMVQQLDSFRGRRSKIDPFVELVGKLADSEVAKRAGVTTQNVRTWRKRRGIPAHSQGVGPSKPEVPSRWAFKVLVELKTGNREYITFGEDIVEAAEHAARQLRSDDARILSLEVVGVAL